MPREHRSFYRCCGLGTLLAALLAAVLLAGCRGADVCKCPNGLCFKAESTIMDAADCAALCQEASPDAP